jgi:hypothetical protein
MDTKTLAQLTELLEKHKAKAKALQEFIDELESYMDKQVAQMETEQGM